MIVLVSKRLEIVTAVSDTPVNNEGVASYCLTSVTG